MASENVAAYLAMSLKLMKSLSSDGRQSTCWMVTMLLRRMFSSASVSMPARLVMCCVGNNSDEPRYSAHMCGESFQILYRPVLVTGVF